MSAYQDIPSPVVFGVRVQPTRNTIAADVAAKAKERDELARLMAEFEAKKAVTVLPYGFSMEAQLVKMRTGEIELISWNSLAKRWGVNPCQLNNIVSKWKTLPSIVVDMKKHYALSDIERLEKLPNFKMANSCL